MSILAEAMDWPTAAVVITAMLVMGFIFYVTITS